MVDALRPNCGGNNYDKVYIAAYMSDNIGLGN